MPLWREESGYRELSAEWQDEAGRRPSCWSVLAGCLVLGGLAGLAGLLLPPSPAHLAALPPPVGPDPMVEPQPSQSTLGRYTYGAVAVDSIPCAAVGK